MQKRKFSLQNFEGGRALSREEMKNVLGGKAAAPAGGSSGVSCEVTCSGSAGAWTYTNISQSNSSIKSDISSYCPSNQATCSGCTNADTNCNPC